MGTELVVWVTIAINAFSGVAAMLHWQAILPGMVKAGVPESWLTFPIGTLKTAGALGLLAGLLADRPALVAAAAIGLVLFFVCALYTHVRAADYTAQFFLAVFFLGMASASLVLTLIA
ncbi:MAG TPA: DoxX family protein [Kribbella sp.]|nr:DoxX family protein [Kribbella sp.]